MKVPDDSIPISELGEVGICERRVYLRAKYGKRTNAQREQRLERGTAIHQAAYEQKRPDEMAQDKRCFIATAVYGDAAWETSHLRDWRDDVLLRSCAGRAAVGLYYKVSPAVARACDRSPMFAEIMRTLVGVAVKLTGGRRP